MKKGFLFLLFSFALFFALFCSSFPVEKTNNAIAKAKEAIKEAKDSYTKAISVKAQEYDAQSMSNASHYLELANTLYSNALDLKKKEENEKSYYKANQSYTNAIISLSNSKKAYLAFEGAKIKECEKKLDDFAKQVEDSHKYYVKAFAPDEFNKVILSVSNAKETLSVKDFNGFESNLQSARIALDEAVNMSKSKLSACDNVVKEVKDEYTKALADKLVSKYENELAEDINAIENDIKSLEDKWAQINPDSASASTNLSPADIKMKVDNILNAAPPIKEKISNLLTKAQEIHKQKLKEEAERKLKEARELYRRVKKLREKLKKIEGKRYRRLKLKGEVKAKVSESILAENIEDEEVISKEEAKKIAIPATVITDESDSTATSVEDNEDNKSVGNENVSVTTTTTTINKGDEVDDAEVVNEIKDPDGEFTTGEKKLSEANTNFAGENYEEALRSASESAEIMRKLLAYYERQHELAAKQANQQTIKRKKPIRQEYKWGVWKYYKVRWRRRNTDCLWRISSYKYIYNNPKYWPLIFWMNKNKIKHPDLIYPGQKLAIPILKEAIGSLQDVKAKIIKRYYSGGRGLYKGRRYKRRYYKRRKRRR